MTNLIFGCGCLGMRVARRWLEAGRPTAAFTRSRQRAEKLRLEGVEPLIGDVTQPATLQQAPAADTVLFAVGFDRTAGYGISEVYVDGLRSVVQQTAGRCRRLIYISSTGVYGQTDGDWVDESTPCRPTREGGKACLAAEQVLAESSLADRAVVLRCAGLYGQGRLPRADDLAAGRPIAAKPDGWLNLIHLDDAAAVVLAAEQASTPSSCYVVSDGHPTTRGEFYSELARRIGAPTPQFTAPAAGDASRRATAADKRVCNRRMRDELQVALQYPTFREGLAAC